MALATSPTASCSSTCHRTLGSVTGQPGTAPSSPAELPCSSICLQHQHLCLTQLQSYLGLDTSGLQILFTLIPALHGFIVHEELSCKMKGRRPACFICRLCVHWFQKHPGGIFITSLPIWAKSSRAWHPVLKAKTLLTPLVMYLNINLFVFLASLAAVWHFFLHLPHSTARPKTDSSDDLCWATCSVLGKKEPTFSSVHVVPDN